MHESLERKKPNTVNGVLDLSERITRKALDVLDKRIASGEISDNMLLRIIVSLGKSTASLCDEALIKQLEAVTFAERITRKAIDVLDKRIDSREINDKMLLRIVVWLGKSTADLL